MTINQEDDIISFNQIKGDKMKRDKLVAELNAVNILRDLDKYDLEELNNYDMMLWLLADLFHELLETNDATRFNDLFNYIESEY